MLPTCEGFPCGSLLPDGNSHDIYEIEESTLRKLRELSQGVATPLLKDGFLVQQWKSQTFKVATMKHSVNMVSTVLSLPCMQQVDTDGADSCQVSEVKGMCWGQWSISTDVH